MAENVGDETAAIGVPLSESLMQPIWSVVDPEAAETSTEAIAWSSVMPRGYCLVRVTFRAALSAPVSAYWPVITPSA